MMGWRRRSSQELADRFGNGAVRDLGLGQDACQAKPFQAGGADALLGLAALGEGNEQRAATSSQNIADGVVAGHGNDRVRFGVLPLSAARDVLRFQAATLAASLSTQVERWHAFWQQLGIGFLWLAVALTLITGWAYLRTGLREMGVLRSG